MKASGVRSCYIYLDMIQLSRECFPLGLLILSSHSFISPFKTRFLAYHEPGSVVGTEDVTMTIKTKVPLLMEIKF